MDGRQIKNLFLKKHSFTQIAKITGLSKNAVKDILRKEAPYNIEIRSDVTEQQILDAYLNQKMRLSRVTKAFGVSQNTVFKILWNHGHDTRGQNSTREKNIDKTTLEDMYIKQKLGTHKIGEQFACSSGTILRYLKSYNIPVRSISQEMANQKGTMSWSPRQDTLARQLLLQHKNYQVVSEILECSYHALENRNRLHIGVPMNFWDTVDENKVKELLNQEKNYNIVANHFGIDKKQIIWKNNSSWHIDLSANSTLFGQPTEYNGIKYRSQAESEVAQLFDSLNINFEYEKRVCDSKAWTCDFYLPDYELWIEYDGLGKLREETGYPQYGREHEKIKYYFDNKMKFVILTKDNFKSIVHAIPKAFNASLKENFSIKVINRNLANELLEFGHYLGDAPKGTVHYYGLYISNQCVGVCTFGRGANKHLSSGVGGEAMELTRLYTESWLPPNSTTFFMAKAINMFRHDRPDIKFLVSFADPNVGHTGGLYKAGNWKFIKQIKSDYCYVMPDGSREHKSRFRCRDGKTEKQLAIEAGAEKVHLEGKLKFVYEL